jgi:type VI secretion system secreted protein VgrG
MALSMLIVLVIIVTTLVHGAAVGTSNPSAAVTKAPSNVPSRYPTAHPSSVPSIAPSYLSYNVSGINLGSCSTFAIQAGTQVSFNGVTTQVTAGNVGVSPGTLISGSYVLGTGAVEDNSPLAIQCASDELTAYTAAKAQSCPPANNLANPDLSGVTLGPGVYCSVFMEITTGSLTLDGKGDSSSVWVFQTATTVITGSSTSIILINGAQACNVYWAVGTAVTIGSSGSFVGTILAGTAITLSSDSVLIGRALAQTAVTCTNGNTVTESCSSVVPSGKPSARPSLRPTSSTTKAPTSSKTITPTSSHT